MSILGFELGQGYANTPLASYDATKWNLSPLWKKRSDIAGGAFFAPILPANFRPVETTAAIPGIMPDTIQWSSTLDWSFSFDNAATAATRRVQLFTFDRTGSQPLPQFVGFINITYPNATNFTFQGARVAYNLYTVGQAAVSGTTVTGTSTLWQTNRMSVGSRIVFGTQDPTTFNAANSSVITAIGAEGTITIADNLGTIGNGNYVIEDLQLYMGMRNATATNGGFFIVKGLSYRDFVFGGTAIPSATTVDNIKACYWLADATTVTNTNAIGLDMGTFVDWTHHYVYIGDSAATTNITIYKYNARVALTNLSSGKDFTSAVLTAKTGSQTGLTGNCAIVDNIKLATPVAGHGLGNGVEALFFCTVTRWYRIPTSGVIGSSTSFVTDGTTEVPPGGVNYIPASGALAFCKYVSTIDAFIIQTSNATGFRAYVSKYYNDGTRFWKIFLTDDKVLDQQAAFNEGGVIHGTTNNVLQTMGVCNGLLYMLGTGTTNITNIGRILPIGADAAFQIASLSSGGTVAASGQILISPKFTLGAGQVLSKVAFNQQDQVGGLISEGIAVPSEALYEFYRTTGISDNSGAWIPFPINDDFSTLGISGTDIQFAALARTIGITCVPPRAFSIVGTYQDFAGWTNFVGSELASDRTTKKFGWLFRTAFSGPVPPARVIIKDVFSGAVLVDDNTTANPGNFQRSTDGCATWGAYANTDKGNNTTYWQYQASMADNVNAIATLGPL